MALLVRFLPVLVSLVLLVYCLIDCIQTDESQCRHLPKSAWVMLILFFPLVGGIAWLVAGRPRRTGGAAEPRRQQRHVVAPDDDPQFLAQLKQSNTEHERMLQQWEDDLRRREQALREGDNPDEPKDKPGS